MLSTDPSYDNMTIASTLKMQIQMVQRLRAQLNASDDPSDGYSYGLCVVSSEGHTMPPHIFEVSLKVNPKVYLDVRKSVVIPWSNQVAGGRPRTRRRSKENQAWLQKECNDFVPFSHWLPLLPRPEPAGLLRLVICREYLQHNLAQHRSQIDRRHPPNIRRALRGACGKGMLPVPDPFGGGDWSWRRLHWIYVSSTT